MASIVSKKQQSLYGHLEIQKNTEDKEEEELEEEIENSPSCSNVVTHLYLKPHSNGTLDREVVLRRIRHHKRVHNVKKAVQALLSSPFSSKINNNKNTAVSAPRVKWVDDAFAAL